MVWTVRWGSIEGVIIKVGESIEDMVIKMEGVY